MEGPWDPIVALHEAISRRFTRASPFVLFTGVSLGVQFSAQMYGAVAMWVFAGREPLLDFMFGSDLNGMHPRRLKFSRVGNAAILMNVAPALLIGHLLPGVGNKIFVPTASLYGIYHIMHDDGFLAWPPSPQLALAVFPYIRSIYYNLWREFVFPYEMKLNRQILGLPPLDPRQNNAAARENRRNGDRNGEGGVIGFLQNILDALDPDDEEQAGIDIEGEVRIEVHQEEGPAGENNDNQDGELVFEVVVEEGEAEENGDNNGEAPAEVPNVPDGEIPQGGNEQENHPDEQHEAPQAPPVQRAGIGTILSNVSNSLVNALILPGISFAMGEMLRLALPKSWTAAPSVRFWGLRPGLLQQQWGRSLIGGCLYVVLKDAIRLYAKNRKVAAMSNRRVKNVDRRRRDS